MVGRLTKDKSTALCPTLIFRKTKPNLKPLTPLLPLLKLASTAMLFLISRRPVLTIYLITIMSRQKFTALQAASGVSIRHRLVDFRLLVSAVLATTADQKLSYGTENGYDVADIAGHYNALARARGLSEVTAPAIEFHLKKPEFTALMLMVFEHLTAQKLKVGIEDADVKKVLALISSAVGKPITDLRATDGCYFCVAASLAKWFPASTGYRELFHLIQLRIKVLEFNAS